MTDLSSVLARTFLSDDLKAARQPGSRAKPGSSRVGTVACVLLLALAGGCGGGGKAVVLKNADEVNAAIYGDPPSLVMFYKQGCATCVALEPTFDKLAKEYKGRALVSKYMIYTFTFHVNSWELKKKYDIAFVPTVLLFVDGQEKKRWVVDYKINDYRKALDEVVAPTETQPSSQLSSSPAGKP
ncbi:MAG: thioredoxin family protein [Phycisphaerae bacterium]|jgi:thiol-disulfide isomerase/thioredoxin